MFSIIIKNKYISTALLIAIAVFFACKKETPVIITPTDPCAQNYELYSKPYENLFKGEYTIGCIVTPKSFYPDKFRYFSLGINPNEKYEFCYLRRDDTDKIDLLRYNFCTNKAYLIAERVKRASDWSSKGFFIFVSETDGKVYKIKSNGDSLKQLPNVNTFYNSPKWSPNGTKTILNINTVIDINGNILEKLPFIISTYVWETDSTIFHCTYNDPKKNFELFRYNFKTKENKLFYSVSKNGVAEVCHFSAKSSKIYGYLQNDNKYNYFILDTRTLEKTSLGTYVDSFSQYVVGTFENKLLVNYDMKDTITLIKCAFNYRNHIALMNFDGTNERQVLIPE